MLFLYQHLFIHIYEATIESSANRNGEARIVIVGSVGYKAARKLDYDLLVTAKPNDGKSFGDTPAAFGRYVDSKLANLYFAKELDQRLQDRGVKNVFCNSCHPGTAGGTGLGSGSLGKVGDMIEPALRGLLGLLGNTNADSAKTQTFLAASQAVKEKNIHGQYWTPVWSWTSTYVSCKEDLPLTNLGNDQEEQKKLWYFSEKALKKAGMTL